MALLGYDPFTQYRGRGPFEARGVGLEVRPGDVAFRCNFATIDEQRVVTDRRAGRPQAGTEKLAALIEQASRERLEGVEVFFKASVEHRAALVLRGPGLDYHVSDVDPHQEGVPPALAQPTPEVPAAARAAAEKTAHLVNQFVQIAEETLRSPEGRELRRQLGLLGVSTVLPRGAGEAVDLKPFAALHGGLRGAMVVEVDLVRGLGLYAGMDVIVVPGATGRRDTDELAIAKGVAENSLRYDVVLCNIKAPDLGGHDRDPTQKIEAIEKVDRAVAYLLDAVDWSRTTLMLGADHCTPVTVGNHTGDAVPVAFFGAGVRRDEVQVYSERAAAAGGIGQISGKDALVLLRNFAGRIEKFGA
jgi:2,3-bisphosphoglycerate-independent phosphoglycerate mutase